MIAKYRCDCGHELETEVLGGSLPLNHDKVHSNNCPACGNIYFKWTNFGGEDEHDMDAGEHSSQQ